MFRCGFCGGLTAPRTPAVKVITARRDIRYPFRRKANVIPKSRRKSTKEEHKYSADPGGVGWGIVREVQACPPCAIRNEPQRE